MIDNYIVIFITTPDEPTAIQIGKRLVSQKLVACAQIEGPVKSIYKWEGKIQIEEEWRLVLKSMKSCFSKIEEMVVEIHPYQIPQIIAIPFIAGYQPYLEWIDESI